MTKSVLIFGGTRGIGRMLSEQYIKHKNNVTVVARSSNDLDDMQNKLKYTGQKINTVVANIDNEEQVANSFACHLKMFNSSPAIVINAAAIQGPIGPTWEISSEQWEKTLKTNLTGSFLVVKAAINVMIPEGRGTVILFSGGGAAFARPNFSAYGVSKTGVLRLVETIAAELHQQGYPGITINAIAPGAVKTRMTEQIIQAGKSAGEKDLKEAAQILHSGGTPPEKIIALVEFLSNKDLNQGLSGNLIHVREDYLDFAEKYKGNFPADAGKLRRFPLA